MDVNLDDVDDDAIVDVIAEVLVDDVVKVDDYDDYNVDDDAIVDVIAEVLVDDVAQVDEYDDYNAEDDDVRKNVVDEGK